MGGGDEAVEQERLAENSDPLASDVHAYIAYALISAHRFDEAAAHCAKELPSEKLLGQCLGRIRLAQGKIEEATQCVTPHPDPKETGGFLAPPMGRAVCPSNA